MVGFVVRSSEGGGVFGFLARTRVCRLLCALGVVCGVHFREKCTGDGAAMITHMWCYFELEMHAAWMSDA